MHVGLRLNDAMLDHVFFLSTCRYGIVQEDYLLCCGKQVEVFSPPAPPVWFRKHTFTKARQLGPEACLVCSLLSHKFGEGDVLVKKLVCTFIHTGPSGSNDTTSFTRKVHAFVTNSSSLMSPNNITQSCVAHRLRVSPCRPARSVHKRSALAA